MSRTRARGFTLVEVMLALAILGMALVVLVRSVAGNIATAQDSFYMGIATDLARGKMYDLEEDLLQEGFQETEQEVEGDFSEEGWKNVTWKALIEPVELPSYDVLMGMAQGQGGQGGEGEGSGTGTGAGPGEEGTSDIDRFQSSAFGSIVNMMGGGGGGGGDDPSSQSEAATGGFLQGSYTMIQQVLKASIRKITLTIAYDTGLRKETFDVVLYIVDAAGMKKTLPNLGGG